MAENKKQSQSTVKQATSRDLRVHVVRRRDGVTRSLKPTPGTGGSNRTPSEKNKR